MVLGYKSAPVFVSSSSPQVSLSGQLQFKAYCVVVVLSLCSIHSLCASWPVLPLHIYISLSLVGLASCVGQNKVISSCVLAAGVAVKILRLLWRLLVIVCKWRRSLSIKASFARVVPHPTAIGPQFIVIGSFGFTSSSSSSFADAPQLDHRRSLQEYILISMPLVPQSPFIGSFGCISLSSSSSFVHGAVARSQASLQEFSASSVVSCHLYIQSSHWRRSSHISQNIEYIEVPFESCRGPTYLLCSQQLRVDRVLWQEFPPYTGSLNCFAAVVLITFMNCPLWSFVL
ncbi:hypothetical protein MP228_006210 [Amoeboaphelidium protococcarum]|nr:hypothetical protein MP228_006210 [Amoeboaphelidium protococcarum]